MAWSIPRKIHAPDLRAREILKYLGPGIMVTVGFIDPGNWASNIAAGSDFGYALLWIVTLSTIMLVILQHNVAHLGIVTGYCLSEAATQFLPSWGAKLTLGSAMGAAIATAVAEILGMALALQMLFGIPLPAGSVAAALTAGCLLLTNSYNRMEKWIIGFVSIIGFSFLVELYLVDVDWTQVATGLVMPDIPQGSLAVIMSVLGAVVMPHNLFLHSEIIQSRQWNLEDDQVIRRQLKYEFMDTSFSMLIGWAINSAMIILAATTFYKLGIHVEALDQAQAILSPLLGKAAAVIFALALLFSGFSSTSTAGMAAGSIFAGIYREPYNIRDVHSRWGVFITYVCAVVIIFFIGNPLSGLIISQIMLSIQLPVTIFLQIYLTSSPQVMGKYANTPNVKRILIGIAAIVTFLNLWLLADLLLN